MRRFHEEFFAAAPGLHNPELSEVRTNPLLSERRQFFPTNTIFKIEEVLWVHGLHEDTAVLRQRHKVLIVTDGL